VNDHAGEKGPLKALIKRAQEKEKNKNWKEGAERRPSKMYVEYHFGIIGSQTVPLTRIDSVGRGHQLQKKKMAEGTQEENSNQ